MIELGTQWKEGVLSLIVHQLDMMKSPGIYDELNNIDTSKVELGKAFKVYMIGAEDKKLIDIHCWHHQLKCDNKAFGYIRSTLEDTLTFEIQEVCISDLAQLIEDIYYNLPTNEIKILVELPAYLMCCFWAEKSNKIYIIDAPFQKIFKHGDILDFNDFIDKLNELKPVQGIIYGKKREE